MRRTYGLYPRRLPLAVGQNLLGSIAEGAAIGILLATVRAKSSSAVGSATWLSRPLEALGPELALIGFVAVLLSGALLTFASERAYVSMSIGLKNALIRDLFRAFWRLGGVNPAGEVSRRSEIRRLVTFATRRVSRAILTLLNGFNASIRFVLFGLIATFIAPVLTAIVMSAGLVGIAFQYYVARKVHDNELRAEAAQRKAATEMADALRQIDRTKRTENEAQAQGEAFLNGGSQRTSDEVFETRLKARVNSELAGQLLFAIAMAVAVGLLHYGGRQFTELLSNASAASVASAVAYLYVLKVMFSSAKAILVSLGVVAKFYSASQDVKTMIEAAERPLLVPDASAGGLWPMIVSPEDCSLFGAIRAFRLIEQCGEHGKPTEHADLLVVCDEHLLAMGQVVAARQTAIGPEEFDRLAAIAPAAAGGAFEGVRESLLAGSEGDDASTTALTRPEVTWLGAVDAAAGGSGTLIVAARLLAQDAELASLLGQLGARHRVFLWIRAGEPVPEYLRVARCYLLLDNVLWGRCNGLPDQILTAHYAQALAADAAESRRRGAAQETDDELLDDELI